MDKKRIFFDQSPVIQHMKGEKLNNAIIPLFTFKLCGCANYIFFQDQGLPITN
jgi:hypothetical protein